FLVRDTFSLGRTRRIAGMGALVAAVLLGLPASCCAAADSVEFGTDARGKPISWTLVFPTETKAPSMRVDDKGQLHLKFGPERTLSGKTDAIELQATDAD